ncbi:MAG: SMP-30/gluconolactonase/LRE family protein [Candidatus Eremiobacteraeota bacterium]|nr:SMP-30/gluconolactonase/LRE family protein [Candidatus Eremiobacteraeota bacterium]MBC5803891.1 SMP-30/gluconolactonase/LRE family protein [Candidatus Eremiobacteraeota bacterium]MBC5821385.1 SMP-30/gluconolactonase/LRE family protein [Candidatus Eremiobacteraeota bacterium]
MATARLLLRTERYTEGVVVDRDGTIFFSMTNLGTISRYAPGAEAAEVWAHVPDSNGHKIDADGTHVVMSSTGAILRLDASGRVCDVVASRVEGRWLTYPNDVWLDPQRGGFYITDSGYKSTPKTMPSDPQGRVYRVEPDGTVRQVADGIAYSNGVALSRDGATLYVSESTARRLWAYRVHDNGDLGERMLLADVPAGNEDTVPDGLTVGPGDRLYLANHGDREILVYAPHGTLERRLDAGNKAASHVAFSPDGGTMYVSGGIDDEQGAGGIFAVSIVAGS